MKIAALETLVPPPLVAAIVALAMLAIRGWDYALPLDRSWRIALAVGFVAAGFAFSLPAMLAFLRARTTINPHHIDRASTLVTGGVFALTRNPMYLGLALQLTGWAAYLGTLAAFLGPLLFVAWITRFQIVPEERLLAARFGGDFEAWRRRTRRWL
jgi:protein-S-isoprenylcysteine O-methyltransferase Ste14